MGVTLKQIADLAGVHKSTVDKVIHNRPGVSDARRQQIKKLLEEYGYESNPLAKALNYQKKKMTVAVVVPTVDAMPALRKGMELVQQDFNSFNIEVVYYKIPFEAAEQVPCLEKLPHEGIAGAVVLPIEVPEVARAMKKLMEQNIPVVAINSDLQTEPYMCYVGQDMVQAGRVAARMMGLLLPRGGKLAVISSNNMRAVKQREHSFRESVSVLCPHVDVCAFMDIVEKPEHAYQQTIAFLQQHPDVQALVITCGCVPDICRAVRDAGRDLTILCYERYDEIAQLVKKGEIACTISGDLREQGRLAMRLLFEKLIYEREPEKKVYYTSNGILLKENI